MRPPLDRRALVEDFNAGFRPRPERLVGLEYELLGVDRATGGAVSYQGHASSRSSSVLAVLEGLRDRFGWRGVLDDPLLELERDGDRITLEPGAQLELSARPYASLAEVRDELGRFLRELIEVSRPLGIAWLPLGMQPLTRPEDIPLIPKQRYRIMNGYLPTRGRGAIWMMRSTAGMQINVDVFDAQEAIHSLRLALMISSPLMALFSNSPFSAGRINGWRSRRSAYWLDVDPDRCGIPESLLAPDAATADYVDWALAAGMFFIERDGRLIDMTGISFGQFLQHGAHDQQATLDDWVLHLTTLFPEARLKTYLELRCPDSNPPELALAYAALARGLFSSGPERIEQAIALLDGWTYAERLEFHLACARHGLTAQAPDGRSAAEIVLALIGIAAESLERHYPDETDLLRPAEALARSGRSSADRLLERWQSDWHGSLAAMADSLGALTL
ncbi:MAG: hypothetical protein JSV80_08325 [Acidobacteriota bacterium]|nr:MAG: hypothetical protein JSV80_08325 [Acidobacteriota bacterium]